MRGVLVAFLLLIVMSLPVLASCDEEDIDIVAKDGEIIVLTDGSAWRSDDPATSATWLSADSVLVCDDVMINKDENGERVGVTGTSYDPDEDDDDDDDPGVRLLGVSFQPTQQPDRSAKLDFPSHGEILNIVDQANRAIDLYEMATKTAEDGATTRLDKDRELIRQTRELLTKIKNDTNSFNALTSIVVLENLDDAARNVALDAVQFTGLTATKAMDGNLNGAKLTLANAPFFSSTGEAVAQASAAWGNQVVRYSVAQAQLSSMAATALSRCTGALKTAGKR